MSDLDFVTTVANSTKLFEISTIIDNEFYQESIKDQIYSGLDCAAANYLEELEIKIRDIMEKYDDSEYNDTILFRENLYRNIISWIEDKYNIDIEYTDDMLGQIATQLYDFFVQDLKESVMAFISYYIQENYKDIIRLIDDSELNLKDLSSDLPKDMQMDKILLNNLGKIVDIVVNINIEYDEFIYHASKGGDIRSITELKEGSHILSVSGSSGMFKEIMTELGDESYDKAIILNVYDFLQSHFSQ